MRILLLSLIICFLFSCKKEKSSSSYNCNLETTKMIKSFTLDSDVKYNAFYLYTFSDDKGKEYLSFLNYRTNQILFYDLKTSEFLFKLNLYAEGPYGTTDEGYKVLPSYTPSSHPYLPPVFIDKKVYITQNAIERFNPIDKTPVSVVIDTIQKSSKGLPLTYNVLTKEEKDANDTRFSRIFNGKEFIYSFYTAEDIVVASIDHSEIKKIKVKSQHIDSSTEKQVDSEQGPKLNLELARYGDLVYDPYREVYYRFAYPKTILEDDIRWWGKAVYGRKKFSVIILNKDFQIIGETLFPEAMYNSYVFFVNSDGLYISRDYQMLYGQSEDYMTFELFKLIEKN